METELKLEFPIARLDALREAIGVGPQPERMVSAYYDTPDDALWRAGFVLRVRSVGGRFVQTVKAEGAAAAGLFVRPEWEMAVPGPDPVIDAAAGPIAGIVGDAPLAPRFATEVARTVRTVEREGATIEIALDTGRVRAGDREEAIAELELELQGGPVAGLFALTRELAAQVPLRIAVRSKAERGRRLGTVHEPATKAEPVRLDPDATVGEAFAAIAGACIRHFRLNEARLLAGDEGAAALHQARVALRRLRTALSLFAPLFDGDARAGVFAAELRAIAARLGTVRDLDVLIAGRDGPDRARLVDARSVAFGEVRALIEGETVRRLVLEIAAWLALGDWRCAPAAGEPVGTFAQDLLSRRRKRLKRRGVALATLDDEARHRVRIAAKKLRYAAEFFASLWTGKKARRRHRAFLAAIEALQDELGRLNDAATARVTVSRLGLAAAAPDVADAPARAEEAYETLMDVKRFWR